MRIIRLICKKCGNTKYIDDNNDIIYCCCSNDVELFDGMMADDGHINISDKELKKRFDKKYRGKE